jgi:hypothetical protein
VEFQLRRFHWQRSKSERYPKSVSAEVTTPVGCVDKRGRVIGVEVDLTESVYGRGTTILCGGIRVLRQAIARRVKLLLLLGVQQTHRYRQIPGIRVESEAIMAVAVEVLQDFGQIFLAVIRSMDRIARV